MANPIPSLDVDDDGTVKITSNARFAAGTKEIMIGTQRTDADGAANTRLVSFVTDINGTPIEKAYVDGTGALVPASVSTAGSSKLSALAGTAGSGTGITLGTSSEIRTVVHKITADFTAFQTAGLTQDVTIWTVPAKTQIKSVIADVTTKFSGGAIASATMRVGKVANGNEFLVDGDVFTAAITLGDVIAERGAAVKDATLANITWGSTQAVVVRITSTGANLSALTQGSCTFYIEVLVYP